MRYIRHFCGMVILATLLIVFASPSVVEAQDRSGELPRLSPNAAVSQTIGITTVEVTYGRPSVRDREIFGGLVPYDRVWRTGADEATVITFSDPVTLGGSEVPAGSYALFTIPGEDEWTIILNDEPDQWGAYNYDSALNVHEFSTAPEEASFREVMTFTFDDVTHESAVLTLHWDTVQVPIDISVDTDALVAQRAEEEIANTTSWQKPLEFAGYALQRGVLLQQALGWAERSAELQENFNNLYVKARIQAALGQYAEAMQTGERAVEKGEEAEDTPVTLDRLREDMRQWEEQI